MTPLAEQHGLDYDTGGSGDGDASRAYALVQAGAWLLMAYRDDEIFPSNSKRARRKGHKLLVKSYGSPASQRAVSFLAQAIGLHLRELDLRVEQDAESAGWNQECVELVQGHYPLSVVEHRVIEGALREYRVFDTHQIPEDIPGIPGEMTGYHSALAEGRNPDDEPDLVRGQLYWAGEYFRSVCGRYALQLALGDRYAKIADDIVDSHPVVGVDPVRQVGTAHDWRWCGEKWTEARSNFRLYGDGSREVATSTPFGEHLVATHEAWCERFAASRDLEQSQRVGLSSASAGATVLLGGFGAGLQEQFADALAHPESDGIEDPIVDFARALGSPENVEAAYRVATWALLAELADHYWRPNYQLELEACAAVFGMDSIYEQTVAMMGQPIAKEPTVDEAAGRLGELINGSLYCAISAAVNKPYEPPQVFIDLQAPRWLDQFYEGKSTMRARLEQLAPDGFLVWRE